MKKKYTAFVLGGLLLLVGVLVGQLFQSSGEIVVNQNITTVPWPTEINFAGEKLPLDDFYVRESWEKEFIVLLDSSYQSLLYLKRSGKYFPLIETKLKERGLPDDLKYLAVAESALIEDSSSHAGAAGIWQFMPGTGRQYGLHVDDDIDERLQFEKATDAALEYLTFLHDKFNNWTLAAAAYNAGENRIIQQLATQQVVDYYELYTNKETSRYLFRILAIKEIMKNAENYGLVLKDVDLFHWPDYQTVSATEIDNLEDWAKEQDSNIREVKELNPWILGTALPESTWSIKVPK